MRNPFERLPYLQWEAVKTAGGHLLATVTSQSASLDHFGKKIRKDFKKNYLILAFKVFL